MKWPRHARTARPPAQHRRGIKGPMGGCSRGGGGEGGVAHLAVLCQRLRHCCLGVPRTRGVGRARKRPRDLPCKQAQAVHAARAPLLATSSCALRVRSSLRSHLGLDVVRQLVHLGQGCVLLLWVQGLNVTQRACQGVGEVCVA